MTTSAQIKAGEAWVMLNAKMGNLKQVLDQAKDKVSTFAGSLSQFGEKVGGKFGHAVVGGFAGFVAIGAIDGAMRKLAERMNEATISGDQFGFGDAGIAIGESIIEGVKSVPILGALTALGEAVGEKLYGSKAEEAAYQAEQKRLEDIAKLREKITGEQVDLQDQLAGNGAQARTDQFERRVRDHIRALVEEGQSYKEASASVGALRDAFKAVLSKEADDALQSLLDGFTEMSGVLSEDEIQAKRLEEQIASLQETLRAAGRDAEADAVGERIRSAFEAAKARAKEVEQAKKLSEVMDELAQKNREMGLSERDRLAASLKELGAGEERIREAMAIFDATEEKRKAIEQQDAEQKQRLEDAQKVADILKQLTDDNATFGMDERAMLERSLKALGATQEQITEAIRIFDETASKKAQADKSANIADILKQLQEQADNAGKTEFEIIQKKLEDLGATVQEIQQAKDLYDAAHPAAGPTSSYGAVGSFSAGFFDPVGIAGGGGALVESTKETARNTRKLVSLMQKNGLVYGA